MLSVSENINVTKTIILLLSWQIQKSDSPENVYIHTSTKMNIEKNIKKNTPFSLVYFCAPKTEYCGKTAFNCAANATIEMMQTKATTSIPWWEVRLKATSSCLK